MRQNLISMFKYANQPEKAKFSVLKSHGLDWAYQGKIDDVSENTQQKYVMKNSMWKIASASSRFTLQP